MHGLDLGNLVAHLNLDDTQYNTALSNAERKLQATANRMTSIGRKLSLRLTVPLAAVGVASTRMAMRVEESENLFSVSMGDMADSTRKWSVAISKALHLNDYEVRRQVSTFNVMLESMGLVPKQAAKMSKGLTKLAYDMASFYNLKPAEAFRKIQAGITGEIEPLKRLGLVINETAVKQWALNAGLIEGKRELTEIEKVTVRYALIMEQTRKAQLDMWRTLQSVTNVMRSLWATVEKAGVAIGNVFMPHLAPVGKLARDLLERFNALDESLRKQIILYASLAAAIGPVLIATGLLLKTLGFMVTTLKVLTAWMTIFSGAISIPVAAVVALAALAYTLRAAWNQNLEAIKTRLEEWFNSFKEGFDWLMDTVLGQVVINFSKAWIDAFYYVKQNFGDFVSDLAATASGVTSWIKKIKEGIVDAWSAPTFHQMMFDFKKRWKEAGSDFAQSFVDSKEKIDAELADLEKRIAQRYKTVSIHLSAYSEATVEHLETLMDAVKKQFGEDADAIIGLIQEKIGLFKQLTPSVEVEAPAVLKYGEDIKEVIEAVKNLQKETQRTGEVTADRVMAYRSIISEMGRMTERVYNLQIRQLEKVAQGYRDIKIEVETVDEWLKEQKELLEVEYLKAIGGIVGGFRAAGMQIKREIQTWGERTYEFSMTLQDSIARGLENSLRDFDNWKDHVLNIFEEIYWSAMRIAFIEPAAQALAGGITGALGVLFPTQGALASAPIQPPGQTVFAYPAQEGGLFTRPTLVLAAEKEPEVFTPLSKMGTGPTEYHVHYHGQERPQITKVEEYALSDRRIIEVTMKAMQTDVRFARNIQQAAKR